MAPLLLVATGMKTLDHWHLLPWICSLGLALSACGGDKNKSSSPIKTTLGEHYLAGIPASEQQDVVDAEQAVAAARRELARVRTEYEHSATLVKLAEYELEQAELEEQAAQLRLELARKRAHLPEIDNARRVLAAASARRAAKEAKLDEAERHRDYLAAELRYRTAHERAMKARHELEKARLARSHQIEPEGFSITRYEEQYYDRMARAKNARLRAREKRDSATRARDRWIALEDRAHHAEQKNRSPRAPPSAESESDRRNR